MRKQYSYLRDYFIGVNTHEEIQIAIKQLYDAFETGEIEEAPKEIIEFFATERKKQLGPNFIIKKNDKEKQMDITGHLQRDVISNYQKNRPIV